MKRTRIKIKAHPIDEMKRKIFLDFRSNNNGASLAKMTIKQPPEGNDGGYNFGE